MTYRSQQDGNSGIHLTVGSGSSKSDYHFSTLLTFATMALLVMVGLGLGALIFGFELLSRV